MTNLDLTSTTAKLDRADGKPDLLLSLVRELADLNNLQTLLAMIRRDDALVESIAARSLRHANGFDKLVLIDGPGPQLRLHIWPPVAASGRLELENAHNHRWGFATQILVGGYTNTTFLPSAGESYARYVYEPGDSHAEYSLTERGSSDLIVHGIADLCAGSSYWTHPSVVHRVSLTKQAFTATLVVMERASVLTTDVFVPRDPQYQVVGDRRHESLSASQARDALDSLAVQLQL